ncbi:HAD-like domain-containing protein [Piptocephalis cylindrospora]|uniref:HAD-like domain-containing protein n=1 Tax=Piptocephalis cylindrospora TaxID=1907219 RepID=A0A4P9Y4F8_9FUNG|nr:HAD-like domain-containing protein [Piptocephalis cylindrospora]|eukprot:RKP13795.1 HAD-like domain-containing protein [Piptocephalis cylindrospora]
MAPQITSILFDNDGLLLNTEHLYTEISQAILTPYGKEFTWDIKVKMMGRTEREGATILLEHLKIPMTVDEYIDKKREIQWDFFAKSEFLPGAQRLLKHLIRHKVPMCVATGSDKKAFEHKTLRHQHVYSAFGDRVVCGDDPAVKKGKPSPDIFLEAARRIDADPATTLVFEDSANGVAAARAAGMSVVWIPDPRTDQTATDATEVLASLEDFKPEKYGLAPFAAEDEE